MNDTVRTKVTMQNPFEVVTDTSSISSQARQKREIDMSGVMGSFLLPLDGLEPLWPLLWLGQWAQVGSGTSVGLGAYRLKAP